MKKPNSLKVGLEIPQEDSLVRFKMRVNEEEDEITVEQAGGQAWSVAGFRVVDGQIHLVRYSSIVDDRFATNSKGQIEETEE